MRLWACEAHAFEAPPERPAALLLRQCRRLVSRGPQNMSDLCALLPAACLPACPPACLPVQHVSEFEDKEFANVSKEDLKLGDQESKQEKKKDKAYKVGGWVGGRAGSWGVGRLWRGR